MKRSTILILGVWVMSVCLPAALRADVLQQVDLGGQAGWLYCPKGGAVWQPIVMPGQVSVKQSKAPWIDFCRRFDVPAEAAGKTVLLQLASINDGGQVYVDHQLAGVVTYGLFPAEIDLTSIVKPGGSYTLTVRCFSRQNYYPPGAFPQDHNGEELLGVPRGVRLAIVPSVRIADVFMRTSVTRQTLGYDVWLTNDTDLTRHVSLGATLQPWNSGATWNYPALPAIVTDVPAHSTLKVSSKDVAWPLGPASYWWPNIPFRNDYEARLHNLQLVLTGADDQPAVRDTFTRRFGFVEYGEGPPGYTINGVRVFQAQDGTQEHAWSVNGKDGFQIAYQQLEGWGEGARGARTTWKNYQRIGINTFRLHSSAGADEMMNAADEVGMMLVGESGIRGYATPEETWDPVYKPAAISAMARDYRRHPAVTRYSLDNEWAQATKDEKIARQLIDAAVEEDPTRLMSFSQDKPPWAKEFFGSDGVHHAWVLDHYYFEPAFTTSQITGIEETLWDRHGTTRNELIGCARDAILFRMRNYATFSPWNWNNYWCNFVAGGGKAIGTINPLWRNKDRRDGIDGWNSDIIRFVQNCYSIFASADVALITNKLDRENRIFDPSNPETIADAIQVERQMVMFNNDLVPHEQVLAWELHFDSPTGPLVESGKTLPIQLPPGTHVDPVVTMSIPGTDGQPRMASLILRTIVDGQERFREDRYILRLISPAPLPAKR